MVKLTLLLCAFLYKLLDSMKLDYDYIGKVLFVYVKNVFAYITSKYKVLIVTGTLGKTSTAEITVSILREAGFKVLHNLKAGNSIYSVITTFVSDMNSKRKEYAVIELKQEDIDLYFKYGVYDYLLITNLIPNMIRNESDLSHIIEEIQNSLGKKKAAAFINGDDVILSTINGKNIYYGIKVENESSFFEFKVPSKLPVKKNRLDYTASMININSFGGMNFFVNDMYLIKSKLKGYWNLYNIISSIAFLNEIGIGFDIISSVIEKFDYEFSKNINLKVRDKNIKVILVNHLDSFNNELALIRDINDKVIVCMAFDDGNILDVDISWIWEIRLEEVIDKIENVLICGSRKYDMAVRIKMTGFDGKNIIICKTNEEMSDLINRLPFKDIYIFSCGDMLTNVVENLFK